MVRSSCLRTGNLFLRKHRKWPHSPYKAKWHRIFNEQQAMRALKQAARTPPPPPSSTQGEQGTPEKPHLLSSLVNSFAIYNCEPTPRAYHFLIKALTKTSQFHHIPSVLDRLQHVEKFETPEYIFVDLFKTYVNCNQIQHGIYLFYRMPKFRCVPSVHSLNTLLSVLCRSSEGLKWVPEILFKSKEMNIRVEESTFRVLISALCRIKRVGYAIEILKCMINDGFTVDVDDETCSLLLSTLCEEKHVSATDVMGFLGDLRKVGFCPGLVDYSNVIRFLVRGETGMDTLDVLNQMKSDGIKPDIVCYTMVLKGVIADGDYSLADKLFDELLVFGLVPDVYTYNVYINGLCKQNNVEAGIKMVACMEELGCKPNLITYNMLVEQLCKVGELKRARKLMREMGSKGIGLNMRTYRIMIHGLVVNGEIEEACALLDEGLDKGLGTHSSAFDEIIHVLCQRGLFSIALELLEKMVDKNISPSVIVWKALVLSSGSKINFVETTFNGLVDTNQTQPSYKNVNLDQ